MIWLVFGIHVASTILFTIVTFRFRPRFDTCKHLSVLDRLWFWSLHSLDMALWREGQDVQSRPCRE